MGKSEIRISKSETNPKEVKWEKGEYRNPNIEIRNKSEGSEMGKIDSFATFAFAENRSENVHQFLRFLAKAVLFGSGFWSPFCVNQP